MNLADNFSLEVFMRKTLTCGQCLSLLLLSLLLELLAQERNDCRLLLADSLQHGGDNLVVKMVLKNKTQQH